MTPLVVAGAVVGYLVGSASPATLVARAKGVDLRDVGSGNPGAANAGRALGRRTGVVIGLLDLAKGLLPALLFGLGEPSAGLVAGVAAVLGHVTSPFLRGRGGKGVATAAGAILGSHPQWAPVVLVTWAAVLAASKWIALASVTAAVSLVVVSVVAAEDRVWAATLLAIVLVRHQTNFAARLRRR